MRSVTRSKVWSQSCLSEVDKPLGMDSIESKCHAKGKDCQQILIEEKRKKALPASLWADMLAAR